MKIANYQPKFYDDVREFKLIADIEDKLFGELELELTQAHANNFVMTASERGIERFEKELGIVANPLTETLDFRRQRIMNRYQMTAPFNLGFLIDKLDRIIGAGNYTLTIDYDNYTMYLEMSVENSNWFKEANLTIQWIKPANIKYIMVPVQFDELILSEKALVSKISYFRVGIGKVGITKLVTLTDEKEVALR